MSARAVCSDIGVLWGVGGASVTSSSSGRLVQQDVGGQLPADGAISAGVRYTRSGVSRSRPRYRFHGLAIRLPAFGPGMTRAPSRDDRKGGVAGAGGIGAVLRCRAYWKGVRDAAGVPEGEIRADPWVVTEAVATAAAVLKRLHTSTWLFPATLFTDGRDGATILRSRVAGSRWETRINHDRRIAGLGRDLLHRARPERPHPARPGPPGHLLRSPAPHPGLVHRPPPTGPGRRRHPIRTPPRPDDLRLRRKLRLRLPDDLAFEDWLARLDTLADAHQRLREGDQVSGPAAETTGTASRPPPASPAESCPPSGTPPPCSPTPTSRSSPARA